MKNKGRFIIGILVIVFALTFIGSGNVGATNCYYLYYGMSDYDSCSDENFEVWSWFAIALHRDKTWEAADILGNVKVSGYWDIFGNAIGIRTMSVAFGAPLIFSETKPMFIGTKTGSAKLLPDPYKSKANIAKAQGYFLYKSGEDEYASCWALRKVKTENCPWIQE